MRIFMVTLLMLAGSLRAEETDVLVYGATPAGIAAAIASARDGQDVLLVEPTARIGGLMTHGLSHTDFRTFEGLNGAFLEFARRVETHYATTYGSDSEQAKASFRGTHFEPKVALLIFNQMLAEYPRVKVQPGRALHEVRLRRDAATKRIESVVLRDAQGRPHVVKARCFIDATYEGDLMAAAGVKYHVGREARAQYGESLAPEQEDRQLQAYNFRLTMTQDPSNRVTPKAPAGYQRNDYTGVLPLLADGRIAKVFDYPGKCVFKAHLPRLPNAKYDINDVSRGLVRLSLPGENGGWPDGNAATRQQIFDHHLRWNVGLLYFLQNDDAVPARFRDEARSWGWCQDEFTETGHLPPQVYVREARRMVGQYVFTEKDTDHAPGDARAVWQRDAIAMGDYGPNCHGTAHEGSRFGGAHTGEFYKGVMPYQIPYGVLVPRDVENLLVPGAVSSSHVGFCALRLEPIWMSLGQAAGHAASVAVKEKLPVQKVPPAGLQRRLHALGAATLYVSDVPPGNPDFVLVQWWGTAGGLHGLAPMPAKPGQRGKNITSQYYEVYPHHAVELDRVLDAGLAKRWSALASQLGLNPQSLLPADGKLTRRDWLRQAWSLRR
ncbi:MAG: FAD-dependent oxidoreductase [Verrucomicrobiota bacterium]